MRESSCEAIRSADSLDGTGSGYFSRPGGPSLLSAYVPKSAARADAQPPNLRLDVSFHRSVQEDEAKLLQDYWSSGSYAFEVLISNVLRERPADIVPFMSRWLADTKNQNFMTLAKKSCSELFAQAELLGAEKEAIEKARSADDQKGDLISLIVALDKQPSSIQASSQSKEEAKEDDQCVEDCPSSASRPPTARRQSVGVDANPPTANSTSRWKLAADAKDDSPSVVRIRLVHINDVYSLEHLPRLKTLIDTIGKDLPPENLVISVGGDLLSPYPLAALDKGRGMVDVLLECGVRFACMGNHEADVSPEELRQRIEEWLKGGGVWLNSNMPDLCPDTGLVPQHTVVGHSRDGRVSRSVGLLGVCTGDPALYVPPDDFGGAYKTALDCNECSLVEAAKLCQGDNKADAVVVLTHQDTGPDRQLARKGLAAGISVVLGGHDHEEYLETIEGCVMAKAGMDAVKAVVIDLLWPTAECRLPEIASAQLLELKQHQPNKAIASLCERHMKKLKDLERLKNAVALAYFDAEPLMSSKNIRKQQTTMGQFICNSLRNELEADCCLFDAGNIRGNCDYQPAPGHERGHRWGFTLSDLDQELPWSSEVVKVIMKGAFIQDAVSYSRSQLPVLFGGFLQTDDRIRTVADDQTKVTHVAGEPIDRDRTYSVVIMHATLEGMNGNPGFKAWREKRELQGGSRIPPLDAARPANVLLMGHLARLAWTRLRSFEEIDTNGDGVLSVDEVCKAFKSSAGEVVDWVAEATAQRLVATADSNGSGDVTREEYERQFRLPHWLELARFETRELVPVGPMLPVCTSIRIRSEQTSMGTFICNGLRNGLSVDCVLLDAGNIRGNMDYKPPPRGAHNRFYSFTCSDLRRELPWPTMMVIVTMTGADIVEAVRHSRSQAKDYPGFLQTDDGVKTEKSRKGEVTEIKEAKVNPKYLYRVAVLRQDQRQTSNPFLEGRVPEKRPGEPAKRVLMRFFAREAWKRMPPFIDLDRTQQGFITPATMFDAVARIFIDEKYAHESESAIAIQRRLLRLVRTDTQGRISKEEYEKLAESADNDSFGVSHESHTHGMIQSFGMASFCHSQR